MYKIIGTDQKEYGPISTDLMRQWAAEGRVNGQTLVWSEAGKSWKQLSLYPEFANLFLFSSPSSIPNVPPLSTGMPPLHHYVPAPAPIPNYLTQSILVTVCCCCPLPLGIVAIIYASQVNTKFQRGDYAGAQAASDKAKLWCWISLGVGLLLHLLSYSLPFTLVDLGSLNSLLPIPQ